MSGLTLQAYLIMPVQRIPRYRLLLEDLLRRTESNHTDYNGLKIALERIDSVARFVNEEIRRHHKYTSQISIECSNLSVAFC
jgi:hypothetical protein